MQIRALFVGVDQESLKAMQRPMDRVGLQTECCQTSLEALRLIEKQKFDALIVDCDDLAGAQAIIPAVRHGRSNKNAVVFAITNGRTDMRAAYDMGANFVLEKPISPERAERSFRAAQGLLLRERRRYTRVRVSWHGTFTGGGLNDSVPCTISNVSEGGCALSFSKPIYIQGHGTVHFQVPHSTVNIEAKVEITWKDKNGRGAGLKFLSIPTKGREVLDQWMQEAFV